MEIYEPTEPTTEIRYRQMLVTWGPALGSAPHVKGPDVVAKILRPLAVNSLREHFYAFYLDNRQRLIIPPYQVSLGTATASLVHPREVFAPALRCNASAVIIAHNHPSGNLKPSAEDIEVTRRLHSGGHLLGVSLIDHVIVGHNFDFYSFQDEGNMADLQATKIKY